MLICSYSGDPSSFGALVASSAQPGAAEAAAQMLNQLAPAPSGTLACGSDNGSVLLIIFGYAGSETLQVAVEPTGCLLATNGSKQAIIASSTVAFFQRYVRLQPS